MTWCSKTGAGTLALISTCLVYFTFGNSAIGGRAGELEDVDERTELIVLDTREENVGRRCDTEGTGGGSIACKSCINPSNLTNLILEYMTSSIRREGIIASAGYGRLVFLIRINAEDVGRLDLTRLTRKIEEFLSVKENERWRTWIYFVLALIGQDTETTWPAIKDNPSPNLFTVATNMFFWSQTRAELHEVYSIHGHMITNRMEHVDNFKRLMNHILYKTKRRSNFNRAFVAVITEGQVLDENTGKFKLEPDDDEAGIFANSITYLQDALNFNIQPVHSEGLIAPGPNGTLLGSAKQLNSNTGDIIVDEWEVIEYRVKGPDGLTFLVPFDTARMLAYFKQPARGFKVNVYVQPFGLSVWVMLAVTWACLAAGNCLITFCGYAGDWYTGIDWDEILIWATGSMSLQSWYFRPTTVPARITIMVASLTALIIYTAYSALLVSMFSIEAQPVKEFDDILNRGEQQFRVVGSLIPSSRRVMMDLEAERRIKPVHNFTSDRIVDATKQETYDSIVSYGLVLVTTSSWFTPFVTAFYPATFVCEHISNVPIPDIAPIKVAFTVRKWSPFREYFDYILLSARERGVMHAWTRRRFVHVEIRCETGIKLQSTGVSLPDSLLAFAVVGLGACLAWWYS